MLDLFSEQARRCPERPALVCEETTLTYAEMAARVNQVARRLRRLGVGPDVPVGLCADRSVEAVVGLWGILQAGGAYVPLEPSQPSARLAAMLAAAAPLVVVASAGREALFAGHNVFCLGRDEAGEKGDGWDGPPVRGEQLAYVIFTSGSTGQPKGVAVEHRSLLNYVRGVVERLELPAGGRYATVSTLAADLGHTMLFPALCQGGRCTWCPRSGGSPRPRWRSTWSERRSTV